MVIKNFKKCGKNITLDICNDYDILMGRWEDIPVDIFLSITGVIPTVLLSYGAYMHGMVITANIFIACMFVSYLIIYNMIIDKE